MLALGERLHPQTPNPDSEFPLTLNADDSPFLQRLLSVQKSVLISDTRQEESWPTFTGHGHLRSWLSVPLVASEQYLGGVGQLGPWRLPRAIFRTRHHLAPKD